MAAAPAPANTTFTSSIRLSASSSAFRKAAAEMIAVPCWSSWKTGIPRRAFELLLDVEALGGLDVLEVDAAERRLEARHALDELVRVVLRDLDVEDVDVGEALEEDPLALHDRLAGEGADVAEAEDGRAVRDDGHEVPLARVLVGQVGVALDLEARLGDARRVGERQVARRRARLGRDDLELSLAAGAVVVEGVLLADAHGVSFLASGVAAASARLGDWAMSRLRVTLHSTPGRRRTKRPGGYRRITRTRSRLR